MASAVRLMAVRHFCRNKHKMAEMSVPAWPIPIHHTKFTISQPQNTGGRKPQTPTPVDTSQSRPTARKVAMKAEMTKKTHHQRGAGSSMMRQIFSVIQWKSRLFKTSGRRGSDARGLTLARTAGSPDEFSAAVGHGW